MNEVVLGFFCRLMDQLAADCALLEELRVMDYSLLLGVHYRSTGWMSSPPVTDKVPKHCTLAHLPFCTCCAMHCMSSLLTSLLGIPPKVQG